MEGRGKVEKTYTYLSCHKASGGLEAAVNEDGRGWKREREKPHYVSWGQGRSFKVSLCPSAQLKDLRLLPVTAVTK